MLEVEFSDEDLARLERDPRFSGGYAPAVVRGFRKAMQHIRAAHDERDLYAARGLRFEKLKGNRDHQRSLRLNDQWRLVVELQEGTKGKRILVLSIEDYH
jgi:proteic killer suppression protein